MRGTLLDGQYNTTVASKGSKKDCATDGETYVRRRNPPNILQEKAVNKEELRGAMRGVKNWCVFLKTSGKTLRKGDQGEHTFS